VKQHDILIGKRDGNYLRLPGSEHVVVYARTRAGKTVGFAIPNAFTWGGSLVCLDVKGEIFHATAGHRKAMGQQVIKLDPTDREMRTHRWNPLSAIDRESPDRFDMIRRMSYSLWPDATAVSAASSNADRFWDPAGRSAFEGVTAIIAETPELPLTLETVLRFFTVADSQERLAGMIEERRRCRPPYSQVAVDQVSDYTCGSVEQVQGIRKVVSTKLAPWFSPRMQAATECSDFDIRDLRRKPMSIYLTVAPGNIPRMRPYLTLFFEQLIALNTDVLPENDRTITHQVLLLLDEFLRVGRIVEVAEAGQYAAGYGMRMAFIVQDKPQLAARYGEDAMQDIFSNVGAECVFGVNDIKTTRELSERIGFNTVDIATETAPRWWGWLKFDKQTTSVHPNKRGLMLPQEIARMPLGEQIVLRPGMMPVRCQRVQWFDDPNFTGLQRPAPVVPSLEIKIALDGGPAPVSRPFDKRLQLEVRPAIKAVPEPVP
jgi:type IV secretion system protein VirD4